MAERLVNPRRRPARPRPRKIAAKPRAPVVWRGEAMPGARGGCPCGLAAAGPRGLCLTCHNAVLALLAVEQGVG